MEDQASSKKRRHDDEDVENAKAQDKRTKDESKDDLDRYTIGWVCALPKEQTAARAMLDEEFRDVHICKAANDTNAYTLGSIGRHMIVIACLPKGQLGVVRASRVATSMTSTFQNIKFVLMVGIGGGVPSGPSDVRLGDVVVSAPTGQYPGVVQWDFGKTKDGKFERTGSLNNPPTFLLTALSKVESDHEMEGSKIQENLDIMFKKWPRLKTKYARSDELEDFLFSANYSHLDRPSNASLSQVIEETQGSLQGSTECLYCDPSKARKREVGEPVVHYGLIASGNHVVKDAACRDDINKNLHSNALCIEMEAAGLMDDFPCLVIRGICDYADSHKSKAWQEHAAAVAAAFTKEFLEKVPPVEVSSECTVLEKLTREIKENLTDFQSTTSNMKSELAKLGSQAKRDEDDKILQWLTPIEYGLQQSDFFRRIQPGTGEWFLKSDKYLTWLKLDTGHQTLFCPGIPGGGKTTIVAAVIDDITNRFATKQDVGIAFVYCNFQRKKEQTLECILSSLVKQTTRGLGTIPDNLATFFKEKKRTGTAPSAQELRSLLLSLSNLYSTLFILVDALDECEADTCSALLSVLLNLPAKSSATIKLVATSRYVPEIENRFAKAQRSEIKATSEDIRSFIRNRLSQIPVFLTATFGLEARITDEISNLVDGMFLLAQLYLEALKDTTSVREVLSALEAFKHTTVDEAGNKRELFHVYDQAYEEAMKRIHGQTPNRRDLGIRVLSWITHATRAITALELQHALALETDHHELDHENLRDIGVMVSVCAGLVTIEDQSMIVRLVHHTAQEYFERVRETHFSGYHAEISSACVRYICIAYDSSGHREQSNVWDKLSLFPLLPYAIYEWGYHAAQGRTLCEDVKKFLLHRDDIFRRLSSFMTLWERTLSPKIYPESGLGWAAYYGMDNAIEAFVQHRYEPSVLDLSGMTPIGYAVMEGKTNFVRILLKQNTDVRNDLLHVAVRVGNKQILEMLLDHGAEVNQQDSNKRTPLTTAVIANQLSTVEVLLKKGALTEIAGERKRPLHEATRSDQREIVKVLLQHGALIDSLDGSGQTALGIAVRNDNRRLVDMLLQNGASITAGREPKTTPLALAQDGFMLEHLARRGLQSPCRIAGYHNFEREMEEVIDGKNMDALTQLVHDGIRQNMIQGHNLEIAMLMAMADSRHAMGDNLCRRLSRRRNVLTRSLLACLKATQFDYVAMVTLLVEVSGTSASQQHFILVCLMELGYWDTAEHMVEKGYGIITMQQRGEFSGRTSALVIALDHGQTSTARLLVENGMDIHGDFGSPFETATPLFIALRDEHLDIARLLIEKGADVNGIQGPDRATAMSIAILNDYYDIAELLVLKGADVNTALPWAIKYHHYDAAKLMIENGADVKSIPALIAACKSGNLGITKLLLNNGADAKNPEALVETCLGGHSDILKLMLERGANAKDEMALATAYSRGHIDTVNILVQEGAELKDTEALCRQGLLVTRQRGRSDAGFLT